MSNPALHLLTFALYSILAILFWRAQSAGNAEQQNRGALGFAVIVPLALHGWLLYDTLFIWGSLNLGLVYALSLILWLTVLVYWLARYFYPLSSLQTLVLPLAAVSTALPAIFPEAHILSQPASGLFDTHVLGAMLAYSLFTIAALHAGLISLVEKRLHHAKLPKVLRSLPPLLTMESLLFRVIGVGFVLLSITIASGMLFSEKIFGHPWQFSHKVLFGILSWGVFATCFDGTSSLRLARAYGGALDLERLRIPCIGLFGHPVRTRSPPAPLIRSPSNNPCHNSTIYRRIRALLALAEINLLGNHYGSYSSFSRRFEESSLFTTWWWRIPATVVTVVSSSASASTTRWQSKVLKVCASSWIA